MVLNATLNNISVISWRSVLLVEETRRKTTTCHKSQTNFISLLGRQYMYVQPHLGLKRTQIDAHLTKSFYSRGFKGGGNPKKNNDLSQITDKLHHI
jgi:hypothetical protein